MNRMVQLRSEHLLFEHQLVERLFHEVDHAYIAYDDLNHHLLITPVTNVWFKKLHDPKHARLKVRNAEGDRTLSISDVLLDHDLDPRDRELGMEVVESTQLMKITV